MRAMVLTAVGRDLVEEVREDPIPGPGEVRIRIEACGVCRTDLHVVAVVIVTIFAWFAILISGTYQRGAFEFVVGVGRWATRVWAYAFLLVTDDYPPFSLQ